MKYIVTVLVCLIALGTVTLIVAQPNKEKEVTEADIEYMATSVDLQTGTFTPGQTENKFQAIIADYMRDLNALNVDLEVQLASAGPFEFESMQALSNVENIQVLRANLNHYSEVRMDYFDKADELARECNTQLGKNDLAAKRHGGAAMSYIESLERTYLEDLDRYYVFLIENSAGITIQGEDIFLERDELVAQYNGLTMKMQKSGSELNEAYMMGATMIRESLVELQKEYKD